jgi:hypothetical protein
MIQELEISIGFLKISDELSCLLGDPGRIGIGGNTGKVDTPRAQFE